MLCAWYWVPPLWAFLNPYSELAMESSVLKSLAVAVAAHFAATVQESENVKVARQERVGLLLAQIKRDAPEMSDGDRANVVYAFGVECRKAGMADSTIAARRSDFLLLLDNSTLIPDAANAWRPVCDAIRLARMGPEKALRAAIAKAEKAVADADARLYDLQQELAGLQGCQEAGLID